MDSTIITGLIGAMATIIAAVISPLIAFYIQRKNTKKRLPKIELNRQKALVGKWAGEVDQRTGAPEVIGKHRVELSIIENKGFIVGDAKMYFYNEGEAKAYVTSSIFDGHTLKLDYINKDNTVIHFGTMYLKLSSDSKTLKGEFLGHGIISNTLVSGKVFLENKS